MITFDLECTDKEFATARITQLAFLDAAGAPLLVSFVNPGCAIKPEAAGVTRITDEMVKGAPAFRDLAERVAGLCDGAVLVAFGGIRFDVPVLARELELAGFDFTPRCVIDAGNLFKLHHPRALGNAVMEYLDEGIPDDLHRADVDAEYTRRVFLAMREQWSELEDMTPEQLAELSNYGRRMADPAGKLAWIGGVLCYDFGQHKGKPVASEPGYADWMISCTRPPFSLATKRLLAQELKRLDAEARAAEPAGLFGGPF